MACRQRDVRHRTDCQVAPAWSRRYCGDRSLPRSGDSNLVWRIEPRLPPAGLELLRRSGSASQLLGRASGEIINRGAAMFPIGRTLICVLLVAASTLGGCTGVPVTSDEQSAQVEENQQRFDRTQDCRQMRRTLLNENLTALQNAEITKNMERAGCGRRLPGP